MTDSPPLIGPPTFLEFLISRQMYAEHKIRGEINIIGGYLQLIEQDKLAGECELMQKYLSKMGLAVDNIEQCLAENYRLRRLTKK